MKCHVADGQLVICLEGRIDSSNASSMSDGISEALAKHPGMPYILDAEGLEYISSAGLRVLLTLSHQSEAPLTVQNVSPEVFDIMEVTGFTRILNVKRRMRSISIDGCPEIGHGAVGTVYRIDADTIVKVYKKQVRLTSIEAEQQRARQAFLSGIPTAIPYDIVRVGKQYGAVFEMVKAENCNDLIVQQPERIDEVLATYVELMRALHSIEIEKAGLPDCREIYQGYLEDLRDILPEQVRTRLSALLRQMPENHHTVHGDLQMKNVLLSDGDPMLIDMETLARGDPVFDFAALYVTYLAFEEDEPGNSLHFLGIPQETCGQIFDSALHLYLNDPSAAAEAYDRIRLLAYVRFLYLLDVLDMGAPELHDSRVEHAVRHLEELAGKTDTLVLDPAGWAISQ